MIETPDGVLLATSHAACGEVLRDAGQWLIPRPLPERDVPPRRSMAYGVQELYRMMVSLNAPAHATQRQPAVRLMPRRALSEFEPVIRHLAGEHVDSFEAEIGLRGRGDFAATVASSVAGKALCGFLGLPHSDAAALMEPSRAALALQEISPGRAALNEAGEAIAFLLEYLRRRLAEPSPAPRFIDALARAETEGDLPEGYAARVSVMLLVGGTSISANHLSSAVLALIEHPQQAQIVRQERTLADSMVDELLRYAPPIHVLQRQAARDGVLCGHPVRAGQLVRLMVAAASRDPALTDNPERLDLTRPRPRHLIFGLGSHYCLGAALARMESAILLPRLLARMPQLTLAGEVARRLGSAHRGIDRLPLTAGPPEPSSGVALTAGIPAPGAEALR
ncbi:cytochrome P450 [Planobispora rosea]|uniref:cytochrome P450 n=2 Tax=Planobispora rosea TaxID=35762 RepID=UPI000839EB4D|nr:cytochrome P450 [Planobispora rosea]